MAAKDFTTLPLRYDQRILPNKKRQATTVSLYEEVVVDVSSMSSEEAPAVGRLLSQQGFHDITYRVARGLDGVVRLMAPVVGTAFSMIVNYTEGRPADGNTYLYNSAINPMHDPRSWAHSPAAFQRDQVISSAKSSALEMLRERSQRMCLVDGVLHAEVLPPRWSFSYRFGLDEHPEVLPDYIYLSSPNRKMDGLFWDWDEIPSRRIGVGEAWDAAAALQVARGQELITRNGCLADVEVRGQMENLVPEAFRRDIAWEDMLHLAVLSLSTMKSEKLQSSLMRLEQQRAWRVQDAVWNWDSRRQPRLAGDIYALAVALHGEKSNGQKFLRDLADEVLKAIHKTRPLASLESRLKAVGIEIPAMEAAENQAQPGLKT